MKRFFSPTRNRNGQGTWGGGEGEARGKKGGVKGGFLPGGLNLSDRKAAPPDFPFLTRVGSSSSFDILPCYYLLIGFCGLVLLEPHARLQPPDVSRGKVTSKVFCTACLMLPWASFLCEYFCLFCGAFNIPLEKCSFFKLKRVQYALIFLYSELFPHAA
jgi:hypothetical protein